MPHFELHPGNGCMGGVTVLKNRVTNVHSFPLLSDQNHKLWAETFFQDAEAQVRYLQTLPLWMYFSEFLAWGLNVL